MVSLELLLDMMSLTFLDLQVRQPVWVRWIVALVRGDASLCRCGLISG
jgi:hypothetical protein